MSEPVLQESLPAGRDRRRQLELLLRLQAEASRRPYFPNPREVASRSLVVLHSGGSGVPLVCMHGLGGHVVGFMPLARSLGSRPVHAFQGRGLMDGEMPHDRIEAMTAAYLAELRTVQPRGPYALLGWSMGGWIALEVARLLQQDGEDVEHLVLVDAYPRIPSSSVLDPEEQSVLSRIAPQVRLSFDDLRALPLEEQWARIRERAERLSGVDEIRRLAAVCQAHLAAIAAYQPAPYAEPIVLLTAEQGCAGMDPQWDSNCPNRRVLRVPGNHYSMLRSPYVEVLAETLLRCLSEKERRS